MEKKEYDYPYIKKRKNWYLIGIVIFIVQIIMMIGDICYVTKEQNIGPAKFIHLLGDLHFGGYIFSWAIARAYAIFVLVINFKLSLKLNKEAQPIEIESTHVTDQPVHNIEHAKNTEPIAKEEVSSIASENVQQETISEISAMIPKQDIWNDPVETADDHSNFCRRCGAKLEPDSIYCHKCGTKVVK